MIIFIPQGGNNDFPEVRLNSGRRPSTVLCTLHTPSFICECICFHFLWGGGTKSVCVAFNPGWTDQLRHLVGKSSSMISKANVGSSISTNAHFNIIIVNKDALIDSPVIAVAVHEANNSPGWYYKCGSSVEFSAVSGS